MKWLLPVIIFIGILTAGFKLTEQENLATLAGAGTGDYGHIYFALGSSSVTAGNFTAVVSSLTTSAQRMLILNTSSSALYFAVGAQSAESSKFIVFPGVNEYIYNVPAATRISVKAFSTGEVINVGRMFINFFGQN